MENRRCTSESCKVAATKRSANLDMPMATFLSNPVQDWQRLAYGNIRVAKRVIDVDWKKFNQDNFLFSHCFVPNTMILMADGTEKPIQNIREGDEVFTHLGRVRKVKNVMSRFVDENLIKLKAASLKELVVTKEHPFWVIEGKDCFCQNKGGKCTYGLSKKCLTSDCKSNRAVGDFVRADEITTGDRVYTPFFREVIDLGITESQMMILGYYIAEGRVDYNHHRKEQTSVRFSISRKEKDTLGLEICELMKSCFGVESHGEFGDVDSGGYTISFHSDMAAEFFLKHVGCGSKEKKISREVMFLRPDLQAKMLLTWFKGDGCLDKKGLRISTASFDLASQCEILFNRIGGLAITHKQSNSGGPTNRQKKGVIWQVAAKKTCLGLLKEDLDVPVQNKWRTGQRYLSENGILSEVKEKSEFYYNGLVYNFSVEEDESYIANRCAVHNCSICCSVEVEDSNGFYIKPSCSELVNNNGNGWANQVLLATFQSFRGGENYLEHVQVPELSKGKILDAVIRPVKHVTDEGESNVYWVDILVATNRKHMDLIDRIQKGELTTLSMGCSTSFVTCSKCGVVLTDDDKNCEHIDNEILQYFTDRTGKRRIVAELCGRMFKGPNGKWVGDPKSVDFIEASWVERPAFTGAVLNHYISEVPKLSSIMGLNDAKLASVMDDIFKLRVADTTSMMALRVAKAEWFRRQREETINKVAKSLYTLR
jgi:intein/homing endonuclease